MITVHLALGGTQIFGGSYRQAKAAAEEWIRAQRRAISAEDLEEEKPPTGVNPRSWQAYSSPCASRIFDVVKSAKYPMPVLRVASLAGISRETAQRVLSVMVAKGEARGFRSKDGRSTLYVNLEWEGEKQ